MIVVHRFTHPEQALHLNSDMIVSIEATPDTVVSLANEGKLVVIETPAQLTELICDWKARVLARALANPEPPRLVVVPPRAPATAD